MWDLIVSVPDHCLSFYFALVLAQMKIIVFQGLFCSGRRQK